MERERLGTSRLNEFSDRSKLLQLAATREEVQMMADEVLELREVVAFLLPISRPVVGYRCPTDEELRVEYLQRRFAIRGNPKESS